MAKLLACGLPHLASGVATQGTLGRRSDHTELCIKEEQGQKMMERELHPETSA